MCAMFGLESLENVWNSGLELWSGTLVWSGNVWVWKHDVANVFQMFGQANPT